MECCLAKANAAGSTPVSCSNACIAQLVEHTLGTGEVMRSSRIASSIWAGNSEVEWRTENSFVGGLIPPWPPSNICVYGETGKRVALRALWWQHFIGSSPITRTKNESVAQ